MAHSQLVFTTNDVVLVRAIKQLLSSLNCGVYVFADTRWCPAEGPAGERVKAAGHGDAGEGEHRTSLESMEQARSVPHALRTCYADAGFQSACHMHLSLFGTQRQSVSQSHMQTQAGTRYGPCCAVQKFATISKTQYTHSL